MTSREQPPREQLERRKEEARRSGRESSEYFLDKCGAEAGDFGDEADEEAGSPIMEPGNPWCALLGIRRRKK